MGLFQNMFMKGIDGNGSNFRPKVIENKKTGQFVLWINHLAPALTPLVSYPDARLMVATSSSPEGTIHILRQQKDWVRWV